MANTANIKDFQKLDIRIGTVVKAEVPEWSHWVVKLTVDLGDPPAGGGERTVFAGVLGFYETKDLEGKQFPFVVNLEPKKIGPKGDYSEGMMMAASEKLDKPVKINDEETSDKPVLISPAQKVPNGTKIR